MKLVQTRWNVVTRSSVAMSGFGPTAAHSRSSGPASGGSEAWRQNLITDPQDIAKVMSVDTALATAARGATAALLLTDSWAGQERGNNWYKDQGQGFPACILCT